MSKRNLIALFAFLALLVALCIFHYRQGENRGISDLSARVDTLVVYDTITIDKPTYITRRVTDTILVSVTDTIRTTDTLYVALPKEQVEWRDSLCVVYASGIRPQVDSVTHFIREKEITRYVVQEKTRRWGVGIQAGYGLTYCDGFKGSPYIGVGVQYNIFAW